MINPLKYLQPLAAEIIISNQHLVFEEKSYTYSNLEQLLEQLTSIDLEPFDILKLRIDSFEKFHFNFEPDKNIDLKEQVKWEMANIISEPLEEISYAYTIFQENDKEIIGIGGYLSIKMIDKLIATIDKKSLQLIDISSKDGQFCFYQKRFNFLISNSIYYKILLASITLLIISVIIATIFSFSIENSLKQKKAQIEELNQEINHYQLTIQQVRNQKIVFEKNKEIKHLNQDLFKSFIDIFNTTPSWIRFKDFSWDSANIIMNIDCSQKEHYLNKYLKLIKKQSSIKDILLVSSDYSPGIINAQLKLTRKGK